MLRVSVEMAVQTDGSTTLMFCVCPLKWPYRLTAAQRRNASVETPEAGVCVCGVWCVGVWCGVWRCGVCVCVC